MIKEAIDLLNESKELLEEFSSVTVSRFYECTELVDKISEFTRRANGQSSGPEQS